MSASRRNLVLTILLTFLIAWGPGLQILGSFWAPKPVRTAADLTAVDVVVDGVREPRTGVAGLEVVTEGGVVAGSTIQLRGRALRVIGRARPPDDVPRAAVVYFPFGCHTVPPGTGLALRRYGATVPLGRQVDVRGYTDSVSSRSFNKWLSRQRADAVASRLHGLGLVVHMQWYGEDAAAAPNQHRDGSDSPAGRVLNRRVEIEPDLQDGQKLTAHRLALRVTACKGNRRPCASSRSVSPLNTRSPTDPHGCGLSPGA